VIPCVNLGFGVLEGFAPAAANIQADGQEGDIPGQLFN
jgi:hypothetical protein